MEHIKAIQFHTYRANLKSEVIGSLMQLGDNSTIAQEDINALREHLEKALAHVDELEISFMREELDRDV